MRFYGEILFAQSGSRDLRVGGSVQMLRVSGYGRDLQTNNVVNDYHAQPGYGVEDSQFDLFNSGGMKDETSTVGCINRHFTLLLELLIWPSVVRYSQPQPRHQLVECGGYSPDPQYDLPNPQPWRNCSANQLSHCVVSFRASGLP